MVKFFTQEKKKGKKEFEEVLMKPRLWILKVGWLWQ